MSRRDADGRRIAGARRALGGPDRHRVATETDEAVFGALRAGVNTFLLKDTPPEKLVEAVRIVAAGEALLTPRELEVIALAASGMSNRDIAEHLVVSPATAKPRVSRAMCKLHARDRAQLVTLAYESGLVVARPNRGMHAGAPALVAA